MRLNWIGIIAITMVLSSWSVVAETNNTGVSDSPASWNGTWESLLYQEIFIQNGTTVTGTYLPISSDLKDGGTIIGSISENRSILTGTWKEIGDVKLTLSDDNKTLDSRWAYSDEDISLSKLYGDEAVDGIWNSENMTMSLFREGSTVMGTYYSLDQTTGVCGFINGTISKDGKVITGTFIESGDVAYVLAADGSSFNGTYTYGNGPVKEVDTWNAIRVQ